MQVRSDFFAGFTGDIKRFDSAMELCEKTLAANPVIGKSVACREMMLVGRKFFVGIVMLVGKVLLPTRSAFPTRSASRENSSFSYPRRG